jgi:AcrR family transcriptional regulator
MVVSRGAGARQRVLQAALQVLDEHGLSGFTMEAVARRAGASKATLYRHWPSSGALLVDAMDATFQPFPVPDTGRVETDVAQLLTAFVALLEDTARPARPGAGHRPAHEPVLLPPVHRPPAHPAEPGQRRDRPRTRR